MGSISRNVRTALSGYEALNRRDLDALVESYADECILTDHAQGISSKSIEEVREWTGQWLSACSDAQITVEHITEAGNTVVCRLQYNGTNDGPLGPLPATGRRISIDGCEILVFDDDGKIVEDHAYYDQLSMLVQLGHVQQPA